MTKLSSKCVHSALLPQLLFQWLWWHTWQRGTSGRKHFCEPTVQGAANGREGMVAGVADVWSCFIFCQEAERDDWIQIYYLLYPRLNLRRRYHPWQVGHSSSVKSFWRCTCYIISNLTTLRLIMASTTLGCRWRILFIYQRHTVVIHFSIKFVPLTILLYG